MKKHIILLALIVLGISPAAKAQVKRISSNDFYEAGGKALLLPERTWRINTKTEKFENGAVVDSMIRTEERILPDKSRSVIVGRTGNVENTLETIIIGSKIYSRINNGQWTVREKGNGIGVGSGFGSSRISCAQYTEEDSSVDGVFARKLSSIDISKENDALTFDNNSEWFDTQGYFLRSERVKGFLEPRIETYRSVTTYEYDPKDLKIEAPIK